jgi:hypothetical protein
MTNENKPVSITEFNPELLEFSEPKVNGAQKLVFVNYNSRHLYLMTDKINLPLGMRKWFYPADSTNEKDASYNVSMALNDVFLEKMKQYDHRLREHIMRNCKNSKGKPYTDEYMDDVFRPTVKTYEPEGKDVVYHSMELKVEREMENDQPTGRFLSNRSKQTYLDVYDGNRPGHKLEIDTSNFQSVIPKGSQARCVFELVYVNLGKYFTTKWRLYQIEVFRNQNGLSNNYLFGDLPQQNEELPDDLDTVEKSENEQLEHVEEPVYESEPEQPEVKPEPVKTTKKKRNV